MKGKKKKMRCNKNVKFFLGIKEEKNAKKCLQY